MFDVLVLCSGSYKVRQQVANKKGAKLYFEQHGNAVDDSTVNYAMGLVASNASSASKALAARYAKVCAEALNISDKGARSTTEMGGRGEGNLVHTAMPAFIGEPLFLSNRIGAEIAVTEAGCWLLASLIRDTVMSGLGMYYNPGDTIALSPGHYGKVPNDRGAAIHGHFSCEADFNQSVVAKAAKLLALPSKGSPEGGTILYFRQLS